jgi:hypothetical protein
LAKRKEIVLTGKEGQGVELIYADYYSALKMEASVSS